MNCDHVSRKYLFENGLTPLRTGLTTTISSGAVWKRDFLEPPKLWTFVKGSLLFSCRHAKTVFENVDNVPLLIQDPASYKQAECCKWQFSEWLGKKTHYEVRNFDGFVWTTDRKRFKNTRMDMLPLMRFSQNEASVYRTCVWSASTYHILHSINGAFSELHVIFC